MACSKKYQSFGNSHLSLRFSKRAKSKGSPIKYDLRRILEWWSFFLAGRGARRNWCRNPGPWEDRTTSEGPRRIQNSTYGEETSEQETPLWVPLRLTRKVEREPEKGTDDEDHSHVGGNTSRSSDGPGEDFVGADEDLSNTDACEA
ncbi:uncharacterized protein RHO17_004578 [Thomomys bottae]